MIALMHVKRMFSDRPCVPKSLIRFTLQHAVFSTDATLMQGSNATDPLKHDENAQRIALDRLHHVADKHTAQQGFACMNELGPVSMMARHSVAPWSGDEGPICHELACSMGK